jgi:mono/diheme cytochrome c family protein
MLLAVILGLASLAGGCAPNMFKQPKNKSLTESDFFADGRAARLPVEGTVARGMLRTDERLYTGKVNGLFVGNVPLPLTRELLTRGRERFDIFCSPCHGRLGDGSGMIVQRGLRRPPSYHIDRLREIPDGYFFDAITNGFGAMPSYASRVGVQDRWAITAYIRALQLSQASRLEDVPPAERPKLLEATK